MHSRRARRLIAWVAGLGLAGSPAVADVPPAPAAPLQKLFTRNMSFKLPVQVDAAARERIVSLKLFVKGPDGAWVCHETAAPSKDAFSFRANRDGEYWFTFATVDRSGRQNPANPEDVPPHRVIVVDTQAPEVTIMPALLPGGVPAMRCEMHDANPEQAVLRVTVRSASGAWQPLEAIGGEGPALYRLPGTPGSDVRVRVNAGDRAGNTFAKELNITLPKDAAAPKEPVAPHRDPVASHESVLPQREPVVVHEPATSRRDPPPLSEVLSAVDPPVIKEPAPIREIPTQREPVRKQPGRNDPRPSPYGYATTAQSGTKSETPHRMDDLSRNTGAQKSPYPPPPLIHEPLPEGPLPLVTVPTTAGEGTKTPQAPSPGMHIEIPPLPSTGQNVAAETAPKKPDSPPLKDDLIRLPPLTPEGPSPLPDSVLKPPPPAPAATQPTRVAEKQAVVHPDDPAAPMPTTLINTTRCNLEYSLEGVQPASVGRVDFWATRDGGKNWLRLRDDSRSRGQAQLSLPGEGSWGISIRGGGNGEPPAAGEKPDCVVEVDLTSPFVNLLPPTVGTGAEAGTLLILWTAHDKNLTENSINLSYATRPDGPWIPVVSGCKNEGMYRWNLPVGAGPQLYLRLEASDKAGNVARTDLRQPVMLEVPRPKVRVLGVGPGK